MDNDYDFVTMGNAYCIEAIRLREETTEKDTFHFTHVQRQYEALMDKAETFMNLAKFAQRNQRNSDIREWRNNE